MVSVSVPTDPMQMLLGAFAATEVDGTLATILDAAYEQFAAVGISSTSMENVARRAGVSRVTVYRHVANRDALVELVLRREFQRYVARYLEQVQSAETAEERIVEGYLSSMLALRTNPLLSGLLDVELDSLVSSMAESAPQVVGMARMFIAHQLRTEQANGEIDASVEVDVVADVLVRVAVSYVLIPSDVVDLDDDAAARAMVRSFVLPLLGWPRT